MNFRIEQRFNGRQLLGHENTDVELKDISTRNQTFTLCASSDRIDGGGEVDSTPHQISIGLAMR